MATWAFYPVIDSRWEQDAPPTNITRLSDGKSIRRQLHSNAPERWHEIYVFSATDHDTAFAIYTANYKLNAISRLSFDKGGTPLQEQNAYFDSPWQVTRRGNDWFEVALDWERAY
jgi:transposase